MDESKWLASGDPAAMLDFLTRRNGGPQGHRCVPEVSPSDRRLRLFAVACCRQAWDSAVCEECKGKKTYWRCPSCWGEWWGDVGPDCFVCGHPRLDRHECKNCHGTGEVGGLTDPRSRRAVEIVERYADGLATTTEFNVARAMAEAARRESPFCPWNEQTPDQGKDMAALAVCELFQPSAANARRHCGRLTTPPATQAALLREIFGNPFRRLPYWDGGQLWAETAGSEPGSRKWSAVPWLRWNDGTVPRIAQGIYDERRWGDMPILGDSLIDGGCDDQTIIDHCRGGGPHVKGCWVLGLILGRV